MDNGFGLTHADGTSGEPTTLHQDLSVAAKSPEHLETPQAYGVAATLGGQGHYEPTRLLSGHHCTYRQNQNLTGTAHDQLLR